jgi:hypothetical protein
MKRFITRIYSLNIFFPYSEKITVLFIGLLDGKVSVRFIGTASDISVTLKHKFHSIGNLNNDLDYFNHLDNYSLIKKNDYGVRCNMRRKHDGI